MLGRCGSVSLAQDISVDPGGGNGGVGNPIRPTATYGEKVLKMQIDAAVRQIQMLRTRSRR